MWDGSPGRWRECSDPCRAQPLGLHSGLRETCVIQGGGARLGTEKRPREGSSRACPVSPDAPLPHCPLLLVKELLCSKERGLCSSQKHPEQMSSPPRLSPHNSEMGNLDKMLTEEARDQLETRHLNATEGVFCFAVFPSFFQLRGKVITNKEGKELKALF